MIRVPLSQYPVASLPNLRPFPGETWLEDTTDRRTSKSGFLCAAVAFGIGIIGGATAMLPLVAFLFMMLGAVCLVVGIASTVRTVSGPVIQVCPDCGTIMARGFATCPQCGRYGKVRG